MCGGTVGKIIQKGASLNPSARMWNALGVGRSNAIRRATDPGSILVENTQRGYPIDGRNVFHPGGAREDEGVVAAREAAAAAQAQADAENAATSSANGLLRSRRLRRRAGSNLATGAVAGTASYTSGSQGTFG